MRKVQNLVWKEKNKINVNEFTYVGTIQDMEKLDFAAIDLLRNWKSYRELSRFYSHVDIKKRINSLIKVFDSNKPIKEFDRVVFESAVNKIILVGISHIVDTKILGSGSAIRTAVIFFYTSNEGISILENSAKIGLPIPEKLKLVLKQLNKEGENNG